MYDSLVGRWSSGPSLQERRGKLGLVTAGSDPPRLYALAGVSGFRRTDQLDSVERWVKTWRYIFNLVIVCIMSDINDVTLAGCLTPGTRGRCWVDPSRVSEVLLVSPLWSCEERGGVGCLHIENVHNKQKMI